MRIILSEKPTIRSDGRQYKSELDRFLDKCSEGETPEGFSGPCVNFKGTGHFEVNGSNYKAGRLAWMHFKGEIPDGLRVIRDCGNLNCVEPNHAHLGDCSEVLKQNRKSPPVSVVIDGVEYQSISDASDATGIPKPLLSKWHASATYPTVSRYATFKQLIVNGREIAPREPLNDGWFGDRAKKPITINGVSYETRIQYFVDNGFKKQTSRQWLSEILTGKRQLKDGNKYGIFSIETDGIIVMAGWE